MKQASLISLITLLCGFASAQQSYTFQQIVVNSTQTVSNGINNAGAVVGFYYAGAGAHGFGYKNGAWAQVNIPGAVQVDPFGINFVDQVVGQYSNRGECVRSCGFIVKGSTVTTLTVNGNFTRATGVNRSGQVVGFYYDGSTSHGFLYDAGKYTRVDFPGGTDTELTGINDAGAMVGESGIMGFVNQNGQFTNVVFPGSESTSALGINNAGEVVGLYFDQQSALHGFLLSGGVYTTIDYPALSGGSGLTGINDQGQIVGYYSGNDCPAYECGFIATPVQ